MWEIWRTWLKDNTWPTNNHNMTRTWPCSHAWLIWGRHTGTWQRDAVDQNRPRHEPHDHCMRLAALDVDPKLVAREQLNSPGHRKTWTKKRRLRHHGDKTKTSRHQWDEKGTSPGTAPTNHRDKNRTCLGENLPTACAAPRRLLHVRPSAYRYWGILNLHQCSSICQRPTSVVDYGIGNMYFPLARFIHHPLPSASSASLVAGLLTKTRDLSQSPLHIVQACKDSIIVLSPMTLTR